MTLLLLSVLVLQLQLQAQLLVRQLVLQLVQQLVQQLVLLPVLQLLVVHLMWRVGLLLPGAAQGGQHHLRLEGVKILCPSAANSALR